MWRLVGQSDGHVHRGTGLAKRQNHIDVEPLRKRNRRDEIHLLGAVAITESVFEEIDARAGRHAVAEFDVEFDVLSALEVEAEEGLAAAGGGPQIHVRIEPHAQALDVLELKTMMACAGRFVRHGDGIAFVFQGDRAPQRLRTDGKLLEVFVDDDVAGRRRRREFEGRSHDGIRQGAPCGVVVAQDAGLRVVERNETDFLVWRAWLEMEIAMFGIDEQRILHDVAFAMARGLPFLQALAVERHRHRRIPVEVVMDIDVLVLNGLVEQRRIVVPVDDVVVEEETAVVFDAAADDLVVEAERQDVVMEVVIASVMLMYAAKLHMMDEIEGLLDFGAAFVGVKAPTACAIIIIGIDVVDVVVGDGRAVGAAERIDAAHV